jgi:hypothetical protein
MVAPSACETCYPALRDNNLYHVVFVDIVKMACKVKVPGSCQSLQFILLLHAPDNPVSTTPYQAVGLLQFSQAVPIKTTLSGE